MTYLMNAAMCMAGATCSLAMATTDVPSSSNVTLFGELDASVATVKDPGTQAVTKVASGLGHHSHIGVRGTEDLGSGWSALFTLDSYINLDTGATALPGGVPGPFWGRESTVGLRGPIGTFRIGRNDSPIFDAAVDGNVFGNAGLAPLFYVIGFATSHPLNGAQDNSVRYDSADIHGFNASYLYRAKEDTASKYWTGAVFYGASDTHASLAVDHSHATGVDGELYSVLVSANHDFQVVRLFGNVLWQRDSGSNQKSRGAEVGASIPAAGGFVKGSAGYAYKETIDGERKQSVRVYGLGYDYLLSKRTDVYVLARAGKTNLLPPLAGGWGNAVTVGVTHRF